MQFLLKNIIFDNIISIFLILDATFVFIFSYIEKKKQKQEEKENMNQYSGIYLFKSIINTIWISFIVFLFTYLCIKYGLISYVPIFYCSYAILMAFKNRKKNINEFTNENRSYYMTITLAYQIFFSSNATLVYIKAFSMINHTVKEYMLITFLIIKLLFFIFCVIINLSILVSNIVTIFKKQVKLIITKINNYINKEFELKFYNLNISNNGQNKKLLIIDIPIYILLCPILIVFNTIIGVLIIASRYILKKVLILGKIISKYLNNSSEVILKTIKISIIISLIIVYIVLVYNEGLIDEKTREIYNLIITVILIPLIYDSIKKN